MILLFCFGVLRKVDAQPGLVTDVASKLSGPHFVQDHQTPTIPEARIAGNVSTKFLQFIAVVLFRQTRTAPLADAVTWHVLERPLCGILRAGSTRQRVALRTAAGPARILAQPTHISGRNWPASTADPDAAEALTLRDHITALMTALANYYVVRALPALGITSLRSSARNPLTLTGRYYGERKRAP